MTPEAVICSIRGGLRGGGRLDNLNVISAVSPISNKAPIASRGKRLGSAGTLVATESMLAIVRASGASAVPVSAWDAVTASGFAAWGWGSSKTTGAIKR